jgi:hypothetical protein
MVLKEVQTLKLIERILMKNLLILVMGLFTIGNTSPIYFTLGFAGNLQLSETERPMSEPDDPSPHGSVLSEIDIPGKVLANDFTMTVCYNPDLYVPDPYLPPSTPPPVNFAYGIQAITSGRVIQYNDWRLDHAFRFSYSVESGNDPDPMRFVNLSDCIEDFDEHDSQHLVFMGVDFLSDLTVGAVGEFSEQKRTHYPYINDRGGAGLTMFDVYLSYDIKVLYKGETPQPVPEPTSLCLFIFGLVGILVMKRKSK